MCSGFNAGRTLFTSGPALAQWTSCSPLAMCLGSCRGSSFPSRKWCSSPHSWMAMRRSCPALELGDLDTSPLGASGAEVPSVCFCVARFTRSATGSKNIEKYLRGLPTLFAKRKVAFPGMDSWEKSCLQAPYYFQKICDGMSTKKFGEAVLQKLKDLTPPHEGSCRLPLCLKGSGRSVGAPRVPWVPILGGGPRILN